MALKSVLLLRGGLNVLFGVFLLAATQSQGMRGFGRGGVYALADGAAGLLIALALFPLGRYWLFMLALVDALARVLLGLLILNNPGLQTTGIGGAFFVTVVIAVCIMLGVAGLVASVFASRRNLELPNARVPIAPIVIMSIATLALGLGLALGFLDDTRRLLLAGYAIVFGASLCWGALSLRSPGAA